MKDLYPSNFLTLIISNDSSITIRSWISRVWPEYIYMGTKCDNTYGNRIHGGLSYYGSLKFTFIKARNESNNKNSSKNIFTPNISIILFLTIFYFFDLQNVIILF
jgi:hypothetical protein